MLWVGTCTLQSEDRFELARRVPPVAELRLRSCSFGFRFDGYLSELIPGWQERDTIPRLRHSWQIASADPAIEPAPLVTSSLQERRNPENCPRFLGKRCGRGSMTAAEPARTSTKESAGSNSAKGTFALVAVPVPVDHGFHYRIPAELENQVELGDRVKVPFHGRLLTGTVVGIDHECEFPKVKALAEVFTEAARIPGPILELCAWVADRFGASLGDTLNAALPPPLRRGGGIREVVHVRVANEELSEEELRELVETIEKRAPKQARTFRILHDQGGDMAERDLRQLAQVTRQPITALVEKGLFQRFSKATEDDPFSNETNDDNAQPHELTAEQQLAIAALHLGVRREGYQGFLLHGVTGSGKTEVYLQTLRRVVELGKSGIVLVPEIALTPQTVARFRARFPRTAVLHSGLTESERIRQWHRIRKGEIDVVVGARSAIFAPLPNLGLIVIDEEHEPSFKQQSPPRYHAREVATKRAKVEGAILILGSATPSLESYVAARSGDLKLLKLLNRVGGGELPATKIVDLGSAPYQKNPRALTESLRSELRMVLNRKEQAILFLNRRGFARINICQHCREPVKCNDCEITLVSHLRIRRWICHMCGHEQAMRSECPSCKKAGMNGFGFGTERVEEELKRTFPRARIARMDTDTTGQRGAHERILGQFGNREIDILVGTQMIAKGLDFPWVTLVGIISADSSLVIPDFRASERTFQLVAQVAGRAGRSARGGKVIVQTLQPSHPAVQAAIRHDYGMFVDQELKEREITGYPPYSQLLRVLISHRDETRCREVAQRSREALSKVIDSKASRLLGPAPCPIARVRGLFRYQLLVKSDTEEELGTVVRYARSKIIASKPVRVTLDVDPVSLL